MKFNHMFTIAYTLESPSPNGDDVEEHEHVSAILKRVTALLDNNELLEAVGCPDDSFEVLDYGISERETPGH